MTYIKKLFILSFGKIKALKIKLYTKHKIKKFINTRKPNQKLRIIFGNHWAKVPDWLILSKTEQDITKRLKFRDNSIDAVFMEHVIEHVNFLEALYFMQESLRILKKEGILRIICPMLDNMKNANFNQPKIETYVKNSLYPHFQVEDRKLRSLNLNGIYENLEIFYFHSLFKLHGHKFIWSVDLMKKVLLKLGFNTVKVCNVGEGTDIEVCIERRNRGIYMGNDWKEELNSNEIFDIESTIIEAIK